MRTSLFVVVPFAIASCGSPQTVATAKGGPRGLRATENLDAAHQHDELARQQGSFPDIHDVGPGATDYASSGVPWVRSWDTRVDHERLARTHRSEAAAIQAEYDEACADRSLADIAVSPLQRYGIGGTNIHDGVVINLAATVGTPDQLLAAMRCHRAWMLLAPPPGMDDCPLDLPDIRVDAHGDKEGISLTIIETRASLVPELQRRAAHELETAAQVHAAAHQ